MRADYGVVRGDNSKAWVAYDAVLWDVKQPLILQAKREGKDMHISASDFRQSTNEAYLDFILDASKYVKVYYKTDEPARVIELLAERRAARDLHENILDRERARQIQSLRFALNPQDINVLNDIKNKLAINREIRSPVHRNLDKPIPFSKEFKRDLGR